MKKLYFVESIKANVSPEGEITGYNILYEDVEITEKLESPRRDNINEPYEIQEGRSPFINNVYPTVPIPKKAKRPLHEGQYVYIDGEHLISVTSNSIAKRRRADNRTYRERLLSERGIDELESYYSDETLVKSYHVNVGHGNCTIILIQDHNFYQIWMVDCGAIDQMNHINYYSNIDNCFADIAHILNKDKSSLFISKFLLTHWHHDHISGIPYLIRDGYIKQTTQFYMNLYYEHSSQCMNEVLKKLDNLHVSCYEPTSFLNHKHPRKTIAILHPNCRIRRKYSHKDPNSRFVSNINNSSVVYSISVVGRTMVFPGDIEKEGLDYMTMTRTCQNQPLCYTDYYCVSHHGSFNGHIDIACRGRSYYNTIGECLCDLPIKKAIIMGRDKAFSGIYSPVVQNYWKQILKYSEVDASGKPCKAYVLEWNSGADSYL